MPGERNKVAVVTCEHLRQLALEIIAAGVRETFRGMAWSDNSREWVYFDCYLDRKGIRKRMGLPECVLDHEHLGTHSGQEAGFVCAKCHDAIMGLHKSNIRGGTLVYH